MGVISLHQDVAPIRCELRRIWIVLDVSPFEFFSALAHILLQTLNILKVNIAFAYVFVTSCERILEEEVCVNAPRLY